MCFCVFKPRNNIGKEKNIAFSSFYKIKSLLTIDGELTHFLLGLEYQELTIDSSFLEDVA